MNQQFRAFDNVEALERDGEELLCRVNGRDVWIPRDRIAVGDHGIGDAGQRGRLILPVEVASLLGLS